MIQAMPSIFKAGQEKYGDLSIFFWGAMYDPYYILCHRIVYHRDDIIECMLCLCLFFEVIIARSNMFNIVKNNSLSWTCWFLRIVGTPLWIYPVNIQKAIEIHGFPHETILQMVDCPYRNPYRKVSIDGFLDCQNGEKRTRWGRSGKSGKMETKTGGRKPWHVMKRVCNKNRDREKSEFSDAG